VRLGFRLVDLEFVKHGEGYHGEAGSRVGVRSCPGSGGDTEKIFEDSHLPLGWVENRKAQCQPPQGIEFSERRSCRGDQDQEIGERFGRQSALSHEGSQLVQWEIRRHEVIQDPRGCD
jgi:hypothetical protein